MIGSLLHYNNTASTDENAVLYIFLTRIANYLAEVKRIPDGSVLVKKILELEEKVGSADNASTFIQNFVSFEKQLFYIFYSTQAAEYQT